jgi:C4-dicarboxylate-specific signal transduction histidine kinase
LTPKDLYAKMRKNKNGLGMKKVLIIDQNSKDIEDIKECIDSSKFVIDDISSIKKSKELIYNQKFDVVILDIHNELSIDILKMLKLKESKTQTIVMSNNLKDKFEDLLSLNIDFFIPKPIDKELLKEKIDIALERVIMLHLMKKKDELFSTNSKLLFMGEMSTLITHQMKQPLSLINMIFEKLESKEEFGELTQKELLIQTEYGRKVVAQASKTVDNFLNFFKSNKKLIPIRVDNLIDKAISIIDAKLKKYNIEVQKEYKVTSRVFTLENQLIEIILNVLFNAIDVLKSKDNAKIYIGVNQTKKFVEIVIRDNGGGIPQNIIHNVFEQFYTTKDKGSGIGLYLAKKFLNEELNGDISAKNVDDGAEFLIRIDLK